MEEYTMKQTDPSVDIDRIRRAREQKTDSNDGGDSPEVFTCPIEGCSRTVIDDASNLRSHVRQAGDDAHRHRTLTEDLEIVAHWERMEWGPGVPNH